MFFKMHSRNPTDTPRRIDHDSMSILRRYVEENISTNFQVMLTYFLDVISMGGKLTSIRRTLFDAISIGKKIYVMSM